MEQHLHVISLNVPYPANYGGVIDIFFKIKALAANGVKIHLHCFEYGRERSSELNKYCESVTYYRRKTGVANWFSAKPYIVQSRRNRQLLQNLTDLPYPILFEGLHTTFYLNNKQLKNRLKIVRTHNIEHDYYRGLQLREKNWLKQLFFFSEMIKLRRYENMLKFAQSIASISPEDTRYFNEKFKTAFWLPPFHPGDAVSGTEGLGGYILYHADLSVPENIEAVHFLLRSLKNSELPVVIAGRNPSNALQLKITGYPNFILVANPSQTEMDRLIQDAQIIALPTFQDTGIKLKLIASLFQGRHCVVNNAMVNHTGLETLCHITNDANEFAHTCETLFDQPFSLHDIVKRKELLEKQFNNLQNANLLVQKIANS